MPYSHSPDPLKIDLRPSRLFLGALLAVHSLALLALWLIPVAGGPWLLALSAVIASALMGFHRGYRLRGVRAVTGLRLYGGELELRRGGAWHGVRLRAATVWPWLVSLQYRHGRWPAALLVLPDACDAADFRRLRIRLRRAAPFAE